tara:strand:- start:594 stop:962 length:369 start_codon:yes stop_codon:yes gene_type:complete
MAEKATASDLTVSSDSEKHTIETPVGELSVWVKDLSWIERQEALSQFVSLGSDGDGNMTPNIDFGGYWRFVFKRCITKTDPDLTLEQLLALKPEVGVEVQKLLPSFDSLMAGMQGGITGPLA